MLYVLNDVITEVYGFKSSRKVIWLALFYNVFAVFLLYMVVYLPEYQVGDTIGAYDQIFSLSPRILITSNTIPIH